MPTPLKSIENTSKHWTQDERERRRNAEQSLERKFVRLVAPPRVVADEAAYRYWKATVERMRGVTLLDNVDVDILASYCQAKAREDELRDSYPKAREYGDKLVKRTLKKYVEGDGVDEGYLTKIMRNCLGNEHDILRLLQSQERLVIKYQTELGLTPAGRVRLAKQRAEEKPATEADDLYGG